ncbi:acyltransferase family protein [Shewanella nanhaiensis]|uniref:Acyltransferase n=1 Tax=Shewanella nanhaiensis TaxID=2864872 RepID=A0ABS7E6C7_9GAMM|nr:acyltransferase [Shewanella nanhaiensis]MBW8185210.1 acyltransferase [Shewanella nanhaiensis]
MINNFDILRFYLALAVVWHHFIFLLGFPPLTSIFNVFDPETAVRAFFVISGALIWESAKNTPSKRVFFYKRFFRIFPAYITVLIISVIISLVLFDADLVSVSKYFFWNATTLNFMQPCIGDVYDTHLLCAQNGSLWTIKIEVAYYLLVLVIFYIFSNFSSRLYFLLGMLSFLLHILFVNFGLFELSLSLKNQLPFLLFYFYLGSYFNPIFKRMDVRANLILFLICSLLYYFSELFYPLFVVSFVFFVVYGLPLYFNINKYGDVSYGLYIYHFPIIQLFISLGVYTSMSHYGAAFFTIFVVCVISYLSWHLIERPSLEFAKRLNKGSKSNAVNRSRIN